MIRSEVVENTPGFLCQETKGMFPITFQNFVKSAQNLGKNAQEPGEPKVLQDFSD